MTEKNTRFEFLYSLDLRSIGAFRIVLAISLLIDLIIYRLPSRIELYTNDGYFNSDTAAMYPDSSVFSLLYYITSSQGVAIFFLVYFILCVGLLLGIRSVIVAPIVYVFYYSIQERTAPFLYGGDDVLRIALFWSMFLPLDKRFGLKKFKIDQENKFAALSSFAILLQISLIYFFNAALKSGETWADGTAAAYAASVFEHSARFSYVIVQNEWLSALLTFLTKAFEYSIPLLVFSPFFNNKTRIAASLIIIVFHFGLIPFLNVNTFYLSTLPLAIVLLPSGFWKYFEKTKHA